MPFTFKLDKSASADYSMTDIQASNKISGYLRQLIPTSWKSLKFFHLSSRFLYLWCSICCWIWIQIGMGRYDFYLFVRGSHFRIRLPLLLLFRIAIRFSCFCLLFCVGFQLVSGVCFHVLFFVFRIVILASFLFLAESLEVWNLDARISLRILYNQHQYWYLNQYQNHCTNFEKNLIHLILLIVIKSN